MLPMYLCKRGKHFQNLISLQQYQAICTFISMKRYIIGLNKQYTTENFQVLIVFFYVVQNFIKCIVFKSY